LLAGSGISWKNVDPADEVKLYVADNKVYGATEIPNGNYPCKDRVGMYISGVTLESKTLHPLSSSALPIYNIMSV
jgi:hypothetical protein